MTNGREGVSNRQAVKRAGSEWVAEVNRAQCLKARGFGNTGPPVGARRLCVAPPYTQCVNNLREGLALDEEEEPGSVLQVQIA